MYVKTFVRVARFMQQQQLAAFKCETLNMNTFPQNKQINQLLNKAL